MKILCTGYKGFLGSKMRSYIFKKHKIAYDSDGDLRDYSVALRETEGMDYVFHFAAKMGGIGYFSKQNYYPPLNNYLIDINILRACEQNKVKRIFYPASACAYPLYSMETGKPLAEWMLNLPAKPDQMYGWEKLSMIKLMKKSKMDIRIGVLHTIYGEGQGYKGEKAKFPPQIAYKALQAVKTNEIEIWGDGTQTRTFLHVDDAIDKIYEVMMSDKYDGEVNIGSDKEVSIDTVVDICCDILNINPTMIWNINKPVGPKRRLCDNTKFNKLYKTRDKVEIIEGFKRIINYIQKNEQTL